MANYRIAKRWYSRRDSNPQNTHPECVVFANFTTRAYMAVFMLPLVSKVGFEPTEKLVPYTSAYAIPPLGHMAGCTGLEPATRGLTVRCSTD